MLIWMFVRYLRVVGRHVLTFEALRVRLMVIRGQRMLSDLT